MQLKDALGDGAVLSVRVPEVVRDRVAALAAERSEKLDDLVGGLIARFLDEAERLPPKLEDVLTRLRGLEAPLRARSGVAAGVRLVVRGDANPDSDVDLAFDFAPDATPSLFDIGRIREEVEQALGRRVDIGERSSMRPHVAAGAADSLVKVF